MIVTFDGRSIFAFKLKRFLVLSRKGPKILPANELCNAVLKSSWNINVAAFSFWRLSNGMKTAGISSDGLVERIMSSIFGILKNIYNVFHAV